MTAGGDSGENLVAEVKEKTKELEKLLDEFSERLRRMRQRNRQLEQDIGSFEEDLDRLRRWLTEHA
jgi:septal ring factor EnvC (AmiA/AmiB activator)